MPNHKLIKNFYSSFSKRDVEGMLEYYHKDIVFQDPAFGLLKGERAHKMWQMLLSKEDSDLKIVLKNSSADNKKGTAEWTAQYTLSDTNRRVLNHVTASFTFEDGKIIEHIDKFDLWKWTRQALGIKGYLLGWTPFMKKKIQQKLNTRLDRFICKENKSLM